MGASGVSSPVEGRYVSYADWESSEAIEAFRARPDWSRMVGAMREHLRDSRIFTDIHREWLDVAVSRRSSRLLG